MFLLSVVIATHNRGKYAKKSIESILSMDSTKMQLVVHDTSDNEELLTYCSAINDPRLSYIHCDESLSMTENFNRALNYATGEYIIIIGDDDTILNTAIKYAAYAKDNNIDIISQRISTEYCWPDFRSKISGEFHSSSLTMRKFSGEEKIYNGREQFDKAIQNCFQGTFNLPKLYHGIVKKTILNTIKVNTGDYFHGVSPDISIAISLAFYVEKYVEVDFPISLPGSSGGSNAGRSALRTHVGRLEDDPHMKRFKNYNWPAFLPRFFSVETVWAQAGIETLEKLTAHENFNFIKFYALCFVQHRKYTNYTILELKKYLRENNETYPLTLIKLANYIVLFYWNNAKQIFKKILKRILKKDQNGTNLVNVKVQDIYEAKKVIDNVLMKGNN